MLQLQASNNTQAVKVPRAVVVPASGDWLFVLTNCTTNKAQEYDDITPAINGQICVFSVALDDCTKGQYKYVLRRGNAVISAGLAMVGFDAMHTGATEYNETKKIIQYNG